MLVLAGNLKVSKPMLYYYFFSVNLNTDSFIRSIYYDICMFIFLSIVNRYCIIVRVIKSN